jgi:hypothetical protein
MPGLDERHDERHAKDPMDSLFSREGKLHLHVRPPLASLDLVGEDEIVLCCNPCTNAWHTSFTN